MYLCHSIRARCIRVIVKCSKRVWSSFSTKVTKLFCPQLTITWYFENESNRLKPIRDQSATKSVPGMRYLNGGNRRCNNSASPKNGRPNIQSVKYTNNDTIAINIAFPVFIHTFYNTDY